MNGARSPRFSGGLSWGRRSQRAGKLNRRLCFEPLELRQLLAISLPLMSPQTVLADAPLNLALNATDTLNNAVNYSVSVSNSTLTNGAQLTTTIPQGNPSLKLNVSDPGDNIQGTMTFQLFQDLTPKTVDEIMGLVNKGSGFYNGLTFHRIIKGFMIQGGDPLGNGKGGPGFEFDDEFNSALQFTSPGLLAMANDGLSDSNGSQFFVTVDPYRLGDFKYTIFGMITSGSTLLDELDNVPTDSNDKPIHTVTITSASIFTDTQNGVLRLSAPNGTTGTAEVTVTATDAVTGDSASRMFEVTVSPDTNTDPPFLGAINPIETVNTPISFTIPSTNVDNVAESFDASILSNDANSDLSVDLNTSTGYTTFTPGNAPAGVYSMTVGVEAANSSTASYDTQAVPIYIDPAAPSGIKLTPASDTGSSDTDNLTNLNNTLGKTLTFEVDGVVSDANVQLFANNVLIGQATASGTSVDITTNGTATLADGVNSITATQTLENQTVDVGNLNTTTNLASVASQPLSITVDTTPPQLDFTPVTVGVVGVPYTCQTAVAGSATGVTYQLLQPPTGMTVNPATGLISWTPDQDQTSTSQVTVQATDAAGNTAKQSYDVDVLASNAAPVLIEANPSLGTTGDNTAITINLAAFINNGSGATTITDTDNGAVIGGIALVGATGTGTWAYSLDGANFTDVGTVAESSALLLPNDAVLRYTPDYTVGETATITYRAWDTTGGAVGIKTDLSEPGDVGGSTAYSTDTDTAALIVTAVNHARCLRPPVLR